MNIKHKFNKQLIIITHLFKVIPKVKKNNNNNNVTNVTYPITSMSQQVNGGKR